MGLFESMGVTEKVMFRKATLCPLYKEIKLEFADDIKMKDRDSDETPNSKGKKVYRKLTNNIRDQECEII
jgi:hypothetical protein